MGTNCAPLVADLFLFCYPNVRNQETGTLKSDCKQSMGIRIIRALNECTEKLLGPPHSTPTRAICSVMYQISLCVFLIRIELTLLKHLTQPPDIKMIF